MEIITKYKAIDGSEFSSKENCIEYEKLIAEVNHIMSALPALPKNDGCAFANGAGFIQHSKEAASRARMEILELALRHCPHGWIEDSIENESIHPSYAARIIEDSGLRPLQDAWHRFQCMTLDFREFGQPFFRDNPEQAEQFDIYPHQ